MNTSGYSPAFAAPAAAVATPQPGVEGKLGFLTLVFFTFSVFSSVVDFIPYAAEVRPSLLAAIVGLLVVAISGRAGALVRHKATLTFVALTFWFVLCIPIAIWPGGAATTITGQWLVTFFSLFLTGGLIWNHDQCRKIVHLIAYSAIILAVLALVLNQHDSGDRLMMSGRYANSNDLATILLTALPFLGFMALRPGNGIRRVIALAGFGPILLTIVSTGSRGGMVGAAMAVLVLFFNIGFAQKMKLIVAGSTIFLLLLAVSPAHITKRFTTLFGDDADIGQLDDQTRSSIASAESRKALLLDSITVTMQHPIFGVGPGNFPVAQNELAKGRGKAGGNWHLTHNTYTQVSSEAGLPGLAMFLLAIFFCLRSISRTLRIPFPPDDVSGRDIRMTALTLRISLAAFLSCAFFASLAYMPVVTILSGLAIALEFCAANLLAGAPRLPLAPVPQPVRSWQARQLQPLPVHRLPRRA